MTFRQLEDRTEGWENFHGNYTSYLRAQIEPEGISPDACDRRTTRLLTQSPLDLYFERNSRINTTKKNSSSFLGRIYERFMEYLGL